MSNTAVLRGPKPRHNIFGFLDETGSIHNAKDVFGIGLVSIHHPSYLHRSIIEYRNKKKFYEEFKFRNISRKNIALYKEFISLFFQQKDVRFHAVLYDETKLDIKKHFSGDKDKAYNSFAARLITKSLDTSDYIVVLADDINTKKTDNFERQVKEKIRDKTRRNALFGICRLESHAVSEIQLTDVILGTVAYAYKIKLRLVHPVKRNASLKVLKHLQKILNIDFLSQEVDLKLKNNVRFKVEEFFKR